MKTISKTDFINFLDCPESFWIEKNKPNKFKKGVFNLFLEKLINEGYEVEEYAKKLFPNGVEISKNNALDYTKALIKENHEVLFQPSFITSLGATARIDILKKIDDNNYYLYEVKSSTSVKNKRGENHINDVCFQKYVLKECGLNISKSFIIHLNKEYIKNGKIDPLELLVFEDVTDQVDEKYSGIVNQINSALNFINKGSIDETKCSCKYKTRSNHCDNFDYFNKDLPEYNIYQLRRISAKKLNELINLNCESLIDVPAGFELNDHQKSQITSTVNGKPSIYLDRIKDKFEELPFPLHFFDYETYSSAIPKVDGLNPHGKLTFQVSVHTLNKSGEIKHFEYLSDKMKFSEDLVLNMKNFTGLTGTFISWHASFEKGRNEEMKIIFPQYIDYLSYINKNMFDLETIFLNLYIDHLFKGSTSLKTVLPIICPEFSYDNEEIQDGTTAMETWGSLVTEFRSNDLKEKIRSNLLSYCKLDSLAMVEIYKQLNNL